MIRQNLFSNTDITRDKQVLAIIDELKASGNGEFHAASLVRILIDLMGASTEFLHYAMERKTKENFRYTATHYGSVIQNAKNIGYDIKRPTPAYGMFGLKVESRNFPIDTPSASTISLPMQMRMKVGGVDIVKHTDFEYKLTMDDITYLTTNSVRDKNGILYIVWEDIQGIKNSDVPDESGVSKVRIVELKDLRDSDGNNLYSPTSFKYIQGVMRDFRIDSKSMNNQVGQKYQRYLIPDDTFSNHYGSTDEFRSYTTVTLQNGTIITPYDISRESFMEYAPEINDAYDNISELKNVCIIESSATIGVELYFGDGELTQKGATRASDILTIRYLSTLGTGGRSAKVDNLPLKVIDRWSYSSTESNQLYESYVKPFAIGPLMGGSDIEEIDSIRYNAGKIFKSLGRLTDREDYESYMRSKSNQMNVKYATAWSEHDELRRLRSSGIKNVSGIPQLANVVMVSVLGELYSTKDGVVTSVSSYDPSVLDNLSMYTRNIYGELAQLYYSTDRWKRLIDPKDLSSILTGIIAQQRVEGTTDNINAFIKDLDSKCEITNRNIYIQPRILPFTIKVIVVVDSMVDTSPTGPFSTKLKSSLYEWCKESVSFSNNFYKSKIIEIAETYFGVKKVDVEFCSSTSLLGERLSKILEMTNNTFVLKQSVIKQHITNIYKQTVPQNIYGSELIDSRDPHYSIINPTNTYWNQILAEAPLRFLVGCKEYAQTHTGSGFNKSDMIEAGIAVISTHMSEPIHGFLPNRITTVSSNGQAQIEIFYTGLRMLAMLDIDDGRYFDKFGNIDGALFEKDIKFATGMTILHPTFDIEYIYK